MQQQHSLLSVFLSLLPWNSLLGLPLQYTGLDQVSWLEQIGIHDHEIFGALPFIYGTLLTSAIAIVIGLPISLGVAIFISERLKGHRALGYALGTLVDLLAAVPSVIYGLWGLLILAPILISYVEKPLNQSLGFIPLFAGTPSQISFFTAGLILAIMIIPTMSAVSRDVLTLFQIARGKQCTRLVQLIGKLLRKVFCPMQDQVFLVHSFLGLGRAVGETMAVTMVIGNTPTITANLFSAGYTLASLIANEFGEATGLYRSAIIEIALILFFVALVINIFARLLLWRMTRGRRVKA